MKSRSGNSLLKRRGKLDGKQKKRESCRGKMMMRGPGKVLTFKDNVIEEKQIG